MSAFMCSNETLSTIAEVVYYVMNGRVRDDIFGNKHFMNIRNAANPEEIFKELRDMNIKALNERYQDPSDMYYPSDLYYIECYQAPYFSLNAWFKVVKKMDCYLYQCSEGNVPEMALFKGVQTLRDDICHFLVMKDARYDEEEWG